MLVLVVQGWCDSQSATSVIGIVGLEPCQYLVYILCVWKPERGCTYPVARVGTSSARHIILSR